MRNWLMLGFGVLVLGLLNFGVVEKERVIANGELVYLELRPVDPRSLLQGDFMRLGFEVENVAAAEIGAKVRNGNIVISPDQNGVAQFVRLDDGAALGDAEYLVHFSKTSSRPTLVPNSYLFQEGEGEAFSEAEYAALVFGADRRDYVLRGLADEKFQLINPRETLGFK
ncbi:GDYXXLXY domain-containing protein [uncultured Maritalea sp.]|uniref:GDYXXLXY domain-containing protein n=1 Tax=uncultured Maritalea sp. TaxID=757249 RepID=UPI0026054647|nr:GDYXXLXY domain-containing protein [uncultured Maritalea sp.]